MNNINLKESLVVTQRSQLIVKLVLSQRNGSLMIMIFIFTAINKKLDRNFKKFCWIILNTTTVSFLSILRVDIEL